MNKNITYKCQNLYFVLITLVLFANLLEITNGYGSENFLYKMIYLFHTPALLFLTGFTAQYNRKQILCELVYPYLLFQMIYLVVDVYWINAGSENTFVLQFTTPQGSLWYLLVVIFCYLLIPLLDTKKKERKVLLLLGSIGLSLLIGYDTQIGNYLAIARFLTFLPFFVVGYYLGQDKQWRIVLQKIGHNKEIKGMLVVGVLLSFFYIWSSSEVSSNTLYGNYPYSVFGYTIYTKAMLLMFSAIWIMFLCVGLPIANKRFFMISTIGKNMWIIYLLHGIVIQVLAKYGVLATTSSKNVLLVLQFTILCLVVFGNHITEKIYDMIFNTKWLLLFVDIIKNIPRKKIIDNIQKKLTARSSKCLSLRQRIFYSIAAVLFFVSFFVFSISSYILDSFNNLSFEELVFHLKVPMKGTGNSMINGYFTYAKEEIIFFLFFYMIILLIFYKCRKLRNKNSINWLALLTSVVCLVSSIGRIGTCLNVNKYINAQSTYSNFLEENFADPEQTELVFPEKKRNLIYIYLESMESTFISKKEGGSMDKNLIPELTKIAKENINFSETSLVGGASAITGGTWTIGAMVSQSTGLPLLIPIDGNSYGEYSEFLPGAVSIGDILKNEGYNQEIMVGSDMAFAGRDLFYQQHGGYEIWDYNTAVQKGKISSSYYEWWGYEDKKLYEYAKEEIIRLSQKEEPFNFSMLTVDTHHVSGYICDLCQDASESQYENVLGCASKQVYEFVQWLQKQDFYENTTIVITGDHPTMDEAYMKEHYDKTKPRKVYNCFINAVADATNAKNREFTTLDMFPTTLSAMGVQIKGERLGLGTNLFSGEKTLVEEHGYKKVETELGYTSKFYNKKILGE